MKFSPLEKVFVMTPHALFYGVITEARSIERPGGTEETYLVRHLDAIARIAELVCTEDQLLGTRYLYSDSGERWLRSLGNPAEKFCDDLIAHLTAPPPPVEAPPPPVLGTSGNG
jgi:hypothetical protein